MNRLAEKVYRRIVVSRTEEGVIVESESEVLVMVVTAYSENTASNISERHKIV